MSDRTLAAIGFIVLMVVLIGLAVLIRAKAPCSLLNLADAKDVPGRCLTVTVRDER